ncbi:carbohydrate-binding family 9-like protein [Balneola sp. MJW-20]|uniref:carbohydrate-binding family 9-like protein n=1 Tax=Gracilimonas aurantiaca TaxID=3234185 RepID=UPI0034663697
MKLFLIVPVLLFTFSSCTETEFKQLDLPLPHRYVIHKTSETMQIDGLASEESWANTGWTSDFMDIEGPDKDAPFSRSRAKMLWDEDYLYFFASMEEEHIWGDITQRDAVIFYNNDFEIFIHPSESEPQYAEFEVNSLGTLWELILLQPYRIGGPVSNYWDLNDTQIGINIVGSINEPSDIDSLWTVEMAIPLKAVAELNRGASVGEGTQWRMNFSRVQWEHEIIDGTYSRKKDPDTGEFLPEYNWVWSPQFAIDMHRPEHWGYVWFTEKPPGSIVNFPEPVWETERQLLFYLHRQQLKIARKDGYFASDINQLGGPVFNVNGKMIRVEMTNTRSGYELTISDPAKGSITLNQDEYITLTE